MQVSLIFALIFAIIVALFAIQNTTIVTIKFLVWQMDLSLVLVILGSVACGALLVFFLNLVKQYSSHREIKKLKSEKESLLKEIDALKSSAELTAKLSECNYEIGNSTAVDHAQGGPDAK